MVEGQNRLKIDQVLRTLATASRSLRLYPPSSPIPRQSVEAVITSLGDAFAGGANPLSLTIAREGFESDGVPVAIGIPGGEELAADLRVHGVSGLHLAHGVTAEDVLKMLLVLAKPSVDVRASGGFGAALAGEAVRTITVSEIALTVIDSAAPQDASGEMGFGTGFGGSDGSGEGYAYDLVNDPARLSAWLSEAGRGDRSGLQSGLGSLVQTVGPHGLTELAGSFAQAFSQQTTDTRDTLLGLAMEPGPFRNLMAEMFRHQSAGEIAAAMLAGSFGRNMLSLSSALASLPLERLDEAVREQVHSMLPKSGHSVAESRFLDHMIEVRKRTEPEPSLAASDRTYLAVAEAGAIRPGDMDKARHALEASGKAVDAAGVRTMLALLDQQPDAPHAEECAANLASLAEHLLGGQQVLLADYVVAELSSRSRLFSVSKLLTEAITPEALGSLLDAAIADHTLVQPAGRILRALDEAADVPFVAQAVIRKADGIALAETLLGKRIIEPLNKAALQAEWYQLRPIVARLTAEGDSRCVATIEALMRRADAQARKEIVAGLTMANGKVAQKLLSELVSDLTPDVAIAAARGLARSGLPGSGDPIAARIMQLDLDNADFELGSELIEALAHTPDRSADELLAKLASRRALIKRGRFTEVQQVVIAAQQTRAREVVGR